MKSGEKEYLVNEKEQAGISRDAAWKEVKDLEEKEKVFKVLWNDKRRLERDNIKLEKELKIERARNFRLKFALDSKKKVEPVKEINGSVNHLRRILNFMEVGKVYSKSSLSEELVMKPNEVADWLKLIMDYKLLEIKYDGVYYIKTK